MIDRDTTAAEAHAREYLSRHMFEPEEETRIWLGTCLGICMAVAAGICAGFFGVKF